MNRIVDDAGGARGCRCCVAATYSSKASESVTSTPRSRSPPPTSLMTNFKLGLRVSFDSYHQRCTRVASAMGSPLNSDRMYSASMLFDARNASARDRVFIWLSKRS
jgi:hypothetical protein